MYDPLVKVPLIFKYPGRARAGERSPALVSNVDLAPTLLGCAGREVPASLAGLDLRMHPEGRPLAFAEDRGGRAYMVRSDRHKLLLCRDAAHSQFFDLQQDPLELDNRIDDPDCRADVQALREALSRWALFEAPSRVHLDEEAPIIGGANVRHPRDGYREGSYAYFRSRMSEPFTLSRRGGSGESADL